MDSSQKNTSQDLLYIDILKVISIFEIYLVHLMVSLKVNQFNFLPSGDGLKVNFNNFFNGQNFYQEEWKALLFIPQAIFQLGWQGVHIFLFCSGFGLYLSYLNQYYGQIGAEMEP
jgi:peptidoglycan/LPS O-acetylase OafA/YrhL